MLLDADVRVELLRLLAVVGFRPLTVLDLDDVDVHDDVDILRWARRRRRILVTHDHFRDRSTKVRMNLEIAERGGRVITLLGGPDQDPYTSLGRILVNRVRWREQFVIRREHGVARLGQQNMEFWDRAELRRRLPHARALDEDLVHEASRRLGDYAPPPGRKRRRPPRPGTERLL